MRMAETTVNSTTSEIDTEDGTRTVTQYRTTVPKAIAESMNMDGAKIEWTIKSGNSVRIEVVERAGDASE